MTSATELEGLIASLRQNRARIVQLAGGDEAALGDLHVTVESIDNQIGLAQQLLEIQKRLEEEDPGTYGGGIEV